MVLSHLQARKHFLLLLLILLTSLTTTLPTPTRTLTKPPTKTVKQATYSIGKLGYNAAKLYVIQTLMSHAITRNFGFIERNGRYAFSGDIRDPIYCLASYALAESTYDSYHPTISRAIATTSAFFNNHYHKNRAHQKTHVQKKTNHTPDQVSYVTDNQLINDQEIGTQLVNRSHYTEEQITAHIAQQDIQADHFNFNTNITVASVTQIYSDHNPLTNSES